LCFSFLIEGLGKDCSAMPHRPVKRAPDNITFAEIEKIAAEEAAFRALLERLRC